MKNLKIILFRISSIIFLITCKNIISKKNEALAIEKKFNTGFEEGSDIFEIEEEKTDFFDGLAQEMKDIDEKDLQIQLSKIERDKDNLQENYKKEIRFFNYSWFDFNWMFQYFGNYSYVTQDRLLRNENVIKDFLSRQNTRKEDSTINSRTAILVTHGFNSEAKFIKTLPYSFIKKNFRILFFKYNF